MNASLHHLAVLIGLLALEPLATAQDRPAALDAVPASWNNILHVRDTVAMLRQFAKSDRFQRATEQIGEDLPLPPQALDALIGMVEPQIPAELFVACPSSTLEQLAALVEAGMLCSAGRRATAAKITDEALDGWRERVDLCLKKVTSPTAFASVRMRSARAAEDLLDDLADWLAMLEDRFGVRVTEDGDALVARLDGTTQETIRSFFGDGAPLQFEITLRLEVVDDALQVTLGSFEADAGAQRQPGPLWRDGEAQLMFLDYEASAAIAHLASFVDVWYEMGEESSDAFVGDDDAIWEAIDLVDRASELDPAIAMSMRVTDRIEWFASVPLAEDDWRGPPLADVGIEAMLPTAGTASYATSMLTFDEGLFEDYSDMLTQLEDGSYKFAERGDFELSAWLMELHDFLYLQMDPLYEFLGGDDSAVFDDGYALVIGQGAPAAASVGKPDGGAIEWTSGDARMPGVALLGIPESGADAKAFVEQLSHALHRGLGVDDEAKSKPVAIDLGLGITTLAIPTGTLMGGRVVELKGDFHPHWCVSDRLILFSTSVELSRRILAGDESATQARAAQDVMARGKIPMAALIEAVRSIEAVVKAFGAEDAAPFRQAIGLGELDPAEQLPDAAFDMIAFVLSLMDEVSYTERQLDDSYETHVVIR